MLISRAQLAFTHDLIIRFQRRSSSMAPIIDAQAQYIAIVVLLRSVGNVFANVDCDTSKKREWRDRKWSEWKAVPIFSSFIEPNRNKLLKEFQGGLEIHNAAFSPPAFMASPGQSNGVTTVADFDASNLVDDDGNAVMPQFFEALQFWDHSLREAEEAFKVWDPIS